MGAPERRPDPIEPAAEELYGVPLSRFTAERKRLADALRAAGDRSLAARVAALPRPSMAAWVVNQLWRESRDDMDELFVTGKAMRAGEPDGWQRQRAVLARLSESASELLRSDGHATSPATLRRVTATLQSLSATGTFAPDPAGRLVADRDPPGFEVLGGDDPVVLPRPARPAARKDDASEKLDQARASAREKAERERRAEKAKSRAAELTRAIERLRGEIGDAEAKIAKRRAALRDAEEELARIRRDAGGERRPRR
jgi:hypothetical protein